MNDRQRNPAEPVNEEHGEDDAVIGVAFRWSLIVFGVVGAIASAFFFLQNLDGPAAEEKKTEVVEAQRREYAKVELPSLPMTDVTETSGLRFVHFNGKEGERLLPETMGGGGGFFDFDNDGDQDILLVNGDNWPWAVQRTEISSSLALFENDGTGKFLERTDDVGLSHLFYGMGCAFGDYDGDGWTDVFVTAVGSNYLFKNNKGVFTDVTDELGVAGGDSDWSCPAMFFDFDRDGRLDLLVGDYVEWSKEIDFQQNFTLVGLGRAYGQPAAFGGTFLHLYRNTGSGFEDVSESSGVQIRNPATNVPVAKSLAFSLLDANRDGWLDFIVANDTVQNFLFINNKDGTFDEQGTRAGLAYDNQGKATGAMGTDCGFYRNDDKLAIAVGNFANEPSSFFVMRGERLQFFDAAVATGLGPQTRLELTFGMFFADLDLDGRQDMVCTNGHLEEEISKVQPNQRYEQPAQIFWNAVGTGGTDWIPLDAAHVGEAFLEPIVGRGSAFADIDADGDLDLLVIVNGQPAKLFRNDQATGNHWLRLKLTAADGSQAIGATIRVYAEDQVMQRTITPTRSYLSQSELIATFGLGKSESIERCEIEWPNGQTQQIEIADVDTVIEVTQSLID